MAIPNTELWEVWSSLLDRMKEQGKIPAECDQVFFNVQTMDIPSTNTGVQGTGIIPEAEIPKQRQANTMPERPKRKVRLRF